MGLEIFHRLLVYCDRLNQTIHRFVAHGARNYRHGASFVRFLLTAISQCDHQASVQINGQMVLFNQF